MTLRQQLLLAAALVLGGCEGHGHAGRHGLAPAVVSRGPTHAASAARAVPVQLARPAHPHPVAPAVAQGALHAVGAPVTAAAPPRAAAGAPAGSGETSAWTAPADAPAPAFELEVAIELSAHAPDPVLPPLPCDPPCGLGFVCDALQSACIPVPPVAPLAEERAEATDAAPRPCAAAGQAGTVR